MLGMFAAWGLPSVPSFSSSHRTKNSPLASGGESSPLKSYRRLNRTKISPPENGDWSGLRSGLFRPPVPLIVKRSIAKPLRFQCPDGTSCPAPEFSRISGKQPSKHVIIFECKCFKRAVMGGRQRCIAERAWAVSTRRKNGRTFSDVSLNPVCCNRYTFYRCSSEL